MIQLAVACHHLEKGNTAGAAGVFETAQRHLKTFLPSAYGIELSKLIERIGTCLSKKDPASLPTIPVGSL